MPPSCPQDTDSLREKREQNRPAVPELQLSVLNGFKLIADGRLIRPEAIQGNAKRLLLFLFVHPTATRERICEELWPDSPPDNARNLLRVCLTRCRQLLQPRNGCSPLRSNREQVMLTGTLRCDLLDYVSLVESAAREDDPDRRRELARKALQATPRKLLDGFYDEWITHLKLRLENQMLELVEWLDDEYNRRGEWRKAVRTLELAAAVFTGEEELYDRLIRYGPLLNRPDKTKEWRAKLQPSL